jgi:hypothetical protein
MGLPVQVIVKGRDVSDQLAAETTTSAWAPSAYEVGAGWWELDLQVPIEQIDAIPATIAGSGTAGLTALVGPAPVLRLVLAQAGETPEMWIGDPTMLPPAARQAPDPAATLARWSERVGPRIVTVRSARKLLRAARGYSGQETFDGLRGALGFGARREWWSDLEGCIGQTPLSQPNRAGMTRVNREEQRWVLGLGDDFHGLWDRDRFGGPVERWPFVEAEVAIARSRELVEDPILQATRLPGERWAADIRKSDGQG